MVAEDTTIPEWVHTIGEERRDRDGAYICDGVGESVLIESEAVAPGETGLTCHNCHYNWQVHEVIFDGPEQYTEDGEGGLRKKDATEFAAELGARLPSAGGIVTQLAMLGMEV